MLGTLSDLLFCLEWSDLTLTYMNTTINPVAIPHESPKSTIGRVAINSSSAKACMIFIILPLLPINTSEAFMPLFLLCQGKFRLHVLIRACLTSVVSARDTVFSAGLILVVYEPFSSKSASATTNAITASVTIVTSNKCNSDNNENS